MNKHCNLFFNFGERSFDAHRDMDNDGIPDRNDNAFQDSDYLESTYDVDERIKEPELTEKPSILKQIADFKAEEQDKVSGGRSKEQER